MADIFISYKREELAFAARVAAALSEEGFSTFYDLHEDGIHAGEQWDKRLEAELEAAGCCVVLWSPASVTSDNVRSEARRAHTRGVLVPAKVGFCTPPMGLDSLQEADLQAWQGDRSDSQWRYLVDRGVARILKRQGRPPATAKPELRRPTPMPPPLPSKPHSRAVPHRLALAAGTSALAVFAILIWQLWYSDQASSDEASPETIEVASDAEAGAAKEAEQEPVEAARPLERNLTISDLFGRWEAIGGNRGLCTELWIRAGVGQEDVVRISRWHTGMNTWEQIIGEASQITIQPQSSQDLTITASLYYGEAVAYDRASINFANGVLRMKATTGEIHDPSREPFVNGYGPNEFSQCQWRTKT